MNRQEGKSVQNGRGAQKADGEYVPPDRGTRAWMVMVASFFCNGIIFGIINSYSVLYTEIYEGLHARNDTESSSKAALVGSLSMGTTFMASSVAGILADMIGIPLTTIIGGSLTAGGLLLSSFFSSKVEVLYFSYGILFGLGAALAYTPSLAILGHYFRKYLGVVNGVVTAGSSVFTMVMPFVIDWFLKTVHLNWTFRLLAVISGGILISAFIFKPANEKTKKNVGIKDAFNVSIWKNKRYVIWAVAIGMSLFGYFVPYVHMLKFVSDNFSAQHDGKIPVICIGIASGIGRIIFGLLADHPKINRIYLQQFAFFSIGTMTMLLPLTKGNFGLLIFATLFMGIFDGCFISLLGPIAFDLCGQKGATQAIGFLLGLCSIPLTIGPFVAGKLYDHMHSYDLAFYLAGVPPIVGSFALFAVKCFKADKTALVVDSVQQPLQQPMQLFKVGDLDRRNGTKGDRSENVGNHI